MPSSFFSMVLRMKYINRWGLMRNTFPESLSQHSMDVAILAHALAVIRNKRFSGHVSPERAAALGLFHDVPEIITGDMPTPVKYYDDQIKNAYKQVEAAAADKLIEMLPEDLRGEYAPLLSPSGEDSELLPLVRAADKLAALIKCIEEEKAGNMEFADAKEAQLSLVQSMKLPEADVFLKEFLDGFYLTLDGQ